LLRLLGQHPQGVSYRPFEREPRVVGYWMEVFRALSGPVAYSRAIHPETTGSPDWWIADRDWLPQMDVGYDLHLQQWLVDNSVEDIASFCRGRVEGFYRSVGRDEGKEHPFFLVERGVNPRLTAIAREVFPRLAELHLIRDPRDILVSRLSFIAKTGVQQFGREAAASDEEYIHQQFASEMRHFLDKWEAADNPALCVRYEDLVHSPEEILGRVFEELDVDAGSKTVLQILDRAGKLSPERQERHRTTSSQDESIGRWRHDLSGALRDACEEAVGETISQLGYG
jgi:hypothetical protein